MKHYVDTSALCRYYHPEPGSDRVQQAIEEPGSFCYVSWLTILETESAFALKVRTGEIRAGDLGLLRKRLKIDVARPNFVVVRVLKRHFDRARVLLAKYGLTQRLRTLDALHLGVAIDLSDKVGVQSIVTADALLEDIAIKEGFSVLNPGKAAP